MPGSQIILCGQVHQDPLPLLLQQQLIKQLLDSGVRVVIGSEMPVEATAKQLQEISKGDADFFDDMQVVRAYIASDMGIEPQKLLKECAIKTEKMRRCLANPNHLKKILNDLSDERYPFTSFSYNSDRARASLAGFCDEQKVPFVGLESAESRVGIT